MDHNTHFNKLIRQGSATSALNNVNVPVPNRLTNFDIGLAIAKMTETYTAKGNIQFLTDQLGQAWVRTARKQDNILHELEQTEFLFIDGFK